jgi:hypothetical protein
VFLFCPEYVPREPERIYDAGIGNVSFYLFGSEKLNVESPNPPEGAGDQEDVEAPRPQDTPSQDSQNEVSRTRGRDSSSSHNEFERDIDLGKDIARYTREVGTLDQTKSPSHDRIMGRLTIC